jgi:spectinomycin phosphotransferase
VIEKPQISDEKIITALGEHYPIRASSIEFLPRGWDTAAWSYRVTAAGGPYFLKVRRQILNPAGMLLPGFLREQGIQQVIVPLLTSNGEAWATVGGFCYSVYPFVRGEQVMEVGMSGEHWREFGSALKRIHAVRVPPQLSEHLRREGYAPQRIEWVKDIHARVRSTEYHDPFEQELAGFWLGEYETISTILERTDALARRMREIQFEFVLCHADVHTANLLLAEDGRIFIVDWDECMLAPKERDLMFVTAEAGTTELDLFLQGYGDAEIHAPALAYYRYDWCIEDIGGFADRIFTSEVVGDETKKRSIWWFKHLFAPGSSVETALNTPIEN